MNFLQLKELLARYTQDVVQVEYSEVEQEALLNQAYALVQKEIVKIDREAHIAWDYTNLEAGVSWYPLPETFSVLEVGVKAADSDTTFTNITPKRHRDLQVRSANQTAQHYTQRGQWIGIFPAPAVAVTNGLEIAHFPIMSLAEDTDIPRIKLPLHIAIVYWAKILALGDTDENSTETRTRLNEILNDLPTWYNLSGDEPEKLQVSL
jgi:hypothetical protein